MDVARELHVRRLGVVPYAEALDLQKRLVEERRSGSIPDQLLLLQHPPVITLGVKARDERAPGRARPAALGVEGVEIFETGRGGDVTYHWPGQLVGYPILDLRPDRCDVHKYVRDLEEALIQAAAAFGVATGRIQGLTGVWAGTNKLAAIGVRISRWITSHGFAFNVATNLNHFDLIVPCGIADKGVTSLEILTGRRVTMDEVENAVVTSFAAVFGRRPVPPQAKRSETQPTSASPSIT